jgi:hypothetical protein
LPVLVIWLLAQQMPFIKAVEPAGQISTQVPFGVAFCPD